MWRATTSCGSEPFSQGTGDVRGDGNVSFRLPSSSSAKKVCERPLMDNPTRLSGDDVMLPDLDGGHTVLKRAYLTFTCSYRSLIFNLLLRRYNILSRLFNDYCVPSEF